MYVQILYKSPFAAVRTCSKHSSRYLFDVLTTKLLLHKLVSELVTHCVGVNKHSNIQNLECLNVRNSHSFMHYLKEIYLLPFPMSDTKCSERLISDPLLVCPNINSNGLFRNPFLSESEKTQYLYKQ